eukprot:TRINITY_DN6077_c0_g1_i1.p1 TRINITY_DN6077_c0_g1~~TRINITY_DN6077_c0_g1_i1.p1  ORF type:complete len:476 (-),score=90.37 TRINITY_DN6077_c0_g1_i1:754-2181(-)
MRTEVILILTVLLLKQVSSTNPGFKATITNEGIEYAKQVGIQSLIQLISQMKIPDQSGSVNTHVIGHINWEIQDITVKKISTPSNELTIVPNQGLQLKMSNVALSLHANWKYREHSFPHIKSHGTVDISISSSTLGSLVKFSESGGQISCNSANVDVALNHLDIHVHGGASWLYNIFIKIFRSKIHDAVDKVIKAAIENGIDKNLDQLLKTIPMKQEIGPLVDADYSLVDNPRFLPTYFTLDAKGLFTPKKDPSPPSFAPEKIPDEENSSSMLQVTFSEYVANTASLAFFKAGEMEILITPEDVPASSPVKLDTNSFEFIVPALYKKYPNKTLNIYLYASDYPRVSMDATNGLTGSAVALMEFIVMEEPKVSVFTLGITASMTAKAYLTGNNLAGNITDVKEAVSLVKSQIGNFDLTQVDSIIELLVEVGLVPLVNTVINKGVPIPTIQNVEFVKPEVGIGNGYLYVDTSVKYTP